MMALALKKYRITYQMVPGVDITQSDKVLYGLDEADVRRVFEREFSAYAFVSAEEIS